MSQGSLEGGPTLARIKGTAMATAVKTLRALGREKAEQMLPRRVHHYLGETRVLSASWYPEEDMLDFNRAVAKLLADVAPGRTDDVYAHMGRLVAGQDLKGVYAGLLFSGTLDDMVRRMAAAWGQYHDTGSMVATALPDGARFELIGFGLPSNELCCIQTGWFTQYFETAGRTGVKVEHVQCCMRGSPSCVWAASWK